MDTATRALVIGRRRPGRAIGATVAETQRLLEAAAWQVDGRVVRRKRARRRHAPAW